MGPEAVRERDLNRYYQPYKNAQSLTGNSPATTPQTDPTTWSLTWDGYKPQFSTDRALTAFAQLATLRLGVRRAMISLVDSKHQYVLTEATRTLSLTRHTIDHDNDRVWLGKSVLNRTDAMCENVFGSTYTARDANGDTFTGDGLVVENLLEREEYKDRPFVVGEPHARFYAGVPIRSRNGHVIGAYACSHNEPRPEGLSISEFRFMQDMAETVMDHLEMIRDREDRTKGERMVRGLAEFIEGSCALGRTAAVAVEKKATSTKPASRTNSVNKGAVPASKVLERQTENVKSMEKEDPDDAPDLVGPDAVSRLAGPKQTKRVVAPPSSNPTCIFYRAADLIRKSTYADGAVFFRTSGPGVRTKAPEHLSSEDTSFDESQSQTSGSENRHSSTSTKLRHPMSPKFTTQRPRKITPAEREDVKFAEVIGLSISENAPGEDGLTVNNFHFPERTMDKYIKKFPYGKFFSFTEAGSGVSSGDDKSEVEPIPVVGANGYKPSIEHGTKGKRQRFIPTEMLKILPGVRTLIFLPLWDNAAERWIAGGFIWTSKAGALLSPHNELPYLKAFGNSISSEYARMNALIADRAKSDFISSISHETRSPLHGILGSVEFISETELTPYQTSLVSSIVTCAKTLLETLEHILDYSKINKLYSRDRNNRRLETRLKRRENERSIMGPTADVDLHLLLEEVSESVCAGHAFRETHHGAGFPSENPKSDTNCNLKRVSVSLEIAPRLKYLVRTQPGAIRRIVMNLLGNSLKYTHQGFIAVTMKGHQSPTDESKVEVTMTFADSGKGMSLEYQRTRLFSPFSQEDPFADGTGLGLSIVRQIVDSLSGHIDIRSTKGVGTTVEVHLTLPIANDQRSDDMNDIRQHSDGRKIALLHDSACDHGHLKACRQALENNNKEWFGVDIVDCVGDVAQMNADAVACHENSPQLTNLSVGAMPIIVVCRNQTNQVALRNKLMKTLPSCAMANVQIVAQPLGPQKLAKILKQVTELKKTAHLHHGKKQVRIIDATPAADLPTRPSLPKPQSQDSPSSSEKIEPPKGETTEPSNAPPAPAPKRPIPLRLKSGLTHDHPPPSHHVLLVDDNAINLQLLTMFMRKIALPHASARDGLEALEKYKSSCTQTSENTTPTAPANFTYVLMDISMPVMDGLESTRRIREFERQTGAKKAIIVALTGLASADAQQDALDAGVDFYLPKPVKFSDLKSLMDV